MSQQFITRSGLSHPSRATKTPYGVLHLSDFLDVWPRDDPAVGVDHIITHDGVVGVRVKGKRIADLP